MEIKFEVTNCLQCPFHKTIDDPDPYDWFCDDDMAVVCTQMPNIKEGKSAWASDHQEFRIIASACRPYNLEKESKIPVWCPKKI